jgi:hypothetical protein
MTPAYARHRAGPRQARTPWVSSMRSIDGRRNDDPSARGPGAATGPCQPSRFRPPGPDSVPVPRRPPGTRAADHASRRSNPTTWPPSAPISAIARDSWSWVARTCSTYVSSSPETGARASRVPVSPAAIRARTRRIRWPLRTWAGPRAGCARRLRRARLGAARRRALACASAPRLPARHAGAPPVAGKFGDRWIEMRRRTWAGRRRSRRYQPSASRRRGSCSHHTYRSAARANVARRRQPFERDTLNRWVLSQVPGRGVASQRSDRR